MTPAEPFVGECDVHAYDYHSRARVKPVGEGPVFGFQAMVGLPMRCPRLEIELDAAEREIEFARELSVIEATPAPARGWIVAVGAATAAALTGWLVASGADTASVTAVCAIAAATGFGLERIAAAVARERMRRAVDWRRRVGHV